MKEEVKEFNRKCRELWRHRKSYEEYCQKKEVLIKKMNFIPSNDSV